ncbi:MAG: zinc transporter ZntB [Zetaproteobacteria bacterium]|nr:zinc transporter ZntB [Zetaproteobacteria bacterium]
MPYMASFYAYSLVDQRALNWVDRLQWAQTGEAVWVHIDYSNGEMQRWLQEEVGLDPLVVDALIMEDTRPRVTTIGTGMLIVLRGVNLNEGADPEDMVAIRLWIDAGRVISTSKRALRSVADIARTLDQGEGPHDTSTLLAHLLDRLIDRMANLVDAFEDELDVLEDRVLAHDVDAEVRLHLAELRRRVITTRRYLAPERDALERLTMEPHGWLMEGNRMHIREIANHLVRYVEALDTVRDRAMVTHEELQSRLSEQMNMRMYTLTIVAAVFLPLGFLTGLFGVNVGGIPMAENSWGFTIFVVGMLLLFGLQLFYFYRKRWF